MILRASFTYTLMVSLSFGAIAVLAGCESPQSARPDRPDMPDAPPPPTPEEIAQKEIEELGLNQPLPRRGATLSAGLRQNILSQFRSVKSRLSGTPEGDIALQQIKTKLEERIRAMERLELWEHALTYTDAHAILDPDSKKFSFLRERALTELRKPRITLRGLPVLDGKKFAVMSIYLPMTSETHFERLRIGEEMHGVKVLEVFGDDKGVKIEYTETGDRTVIYMPTAK